MYSNGPIFKESTTLLNPTTSKHYKLSTDDAKWFHDVFVEACPFLQIFSFVDHTYGFHADGKSRHAATVISICQAQKVNYCDQIVMHNHFLLQHQIFAVK